MIYAAEPPARFLAGFAKGGVVTVGSEVWRGTSVGFNSAMLVDVANDELTIDGGQLDAIWWVGYKSSVDKWFSYDISPIDDAGGEILGNHTWWVAYEQIAGPYRVSVYIEGAWEE
jgi:hypothetical protein